LADLANLCVRGKHSLASSAQIACGTFRTRNGGLSCNSSSANSGRLPAASCWRSNRSWAGATASDALTRSSVTVATTPSVRSNGHTARWPDSSVSAYRTKCICAGQPPHRTGDSGRSFRLFRMYDVAVGLLIRAVWPTNFGPPFRAAS